MHNASSRQIPVCLQVTECHLVTDPRTKESRGFAFVTMETNEDADRCVKHLNRSVLEGRLITVEKVLFCLKKVQINALYSWPYCLCLTFLLFHYVLLIFRKVA